MALLYVCPYNREHETKELDLLCHQKPSSIRVILGPRSCGKTATLVSYLQGKDNIVYIDCRGIDSSTPPRFMKVCVSASLLSFLACVVIVSGYH